VNGSLSISLDTIGHSEVCHLIQDCALEHQLFELIINLASLQPFADDEAISCWAEMCPGNNESAGKRKSGRTSKGNRWLRRALVESAYAAARKKDRYLAAQFARLARGGKKRAAVAVGHTILVAAYHILKEEVDYKDLGGDYFQKRNQEKTTRRLIKQLEQFGYQVELKRVA